MSISMDKFAKFINEQMKVKQWNQSDLARASGLSKQVISYYLGDKSKTPDINAIKSLARAFHLPVEMVLQAAGFLPPTPNDPWLDKMQHKIQQVEKGQRQKLEKLIDAFIDDE